MFCGSKLQNSGLLDAVVKGLHFCIGTIVVGLVITGSTWLQDKGLDVLVNHVTKGTETKLNVANIKSKWLYC